VESVFLPPKVSAGSVYRICLAVRQVLAVIQDAVTKTDAPACYLSGVAYTVPPEKPLYDAGQIMMVPPTVVGGGGGWVKVANDKLREVNLEARANN